MTSRIKSLTAEAEAIGFTIKYERPPRPQLRGGCLPHRGVILVAPGMSTAQTVATIAHELGHVYHGHGGCGGRLSECAEKVAWEWAARRLISPSEYRVAEITYGPNSGALAVELDVTPPVIEAYQRLLARMAA